MVFIERISKTHELTDCIFGVADDTTSHGLVEKLKLAWFEKRGKKRASRARQEELPTSSGFTAHTLSRHSSTHLAEIEEEELSVAPFTTM